MEIETKQRRTRSATPDNLVEKIKLLSLEDKLRMHSLLKAEIDSEKKRLEEQLKLITN